MMYVIYNNDGSIKSKFLNEFVMQGNSYENVLFVAFEDRSADTYTLYAEFRLPNGATTTVVSGSTPQTRNVAGLGTYTGKSISLSNAETLVAGALQMNIKVLTTDTEKVLVSFNTYITVNETGLQPSDPVIITAQEYQNLLSMIGSQVANYQCILKGINLAAFGDLNDYQVGQALYVSNSEECKLYEVDSNHEALLKVNLLDKYTKAQIDAKLDNKVDKSLAHSVVYANDSSGVQTAIDYDSAVRGSTFVIRDANGHVRTNTPTGQWDATNKAYVDEQINTYAAYYITKNAAGDAFATRSELMSASTFYSGGVVRVPTRNDYCYVLSDENHDNATTKYVYNNGWEFQIVINETAFTQAQLDAINSGATTSKINAIESKVAKTSSFSQLYGTDGTGNQTTLTYATTADSNTVAVRAAGGRLNAADPITNSNVTTKSYVDTALADKFDKTNILNTTGGESANNVYSALFVDNALTDLKEIATGKTRTFTTSTTCTTSQIEDLITNGKNVMYYSGTWKAFASVAEFTTWRTGKAIGSGSQLEQLVNDLSITDILVTNSSYYWIFDNQDNCYLITQADYDLILSENDNLMVIETSCPDRWIMGTHLYALETAKLGYHALGTTSDPVPFITTQTITSTTPSLSLNSLKTYKCTNALTSLTISALVTDTNDNNASWRVDFVADENFAITFASGITWKYGTPTFNAGDEYTIIIEKRVDNSYYAFLI